MTCLFFAQPISGGKLVALLINYACHGTTLVPEHNFVHGDWMGATQDMIEKKYPGAIAMVAIGCAGDANPSPRGEFGHVNQHATMITDKIDKLLQAEKFTALNNIPVGKDEKGRTYVRPCAGCKGIC